jgi:serine/threonine protein kinase
LRPSPLFRTAISNEDEDDIVQAPAQVGNYQILEVLGSGAFATVFRARHRVTMGVVALKAIPKRKLRTMQEFELLQREVNLMKIMDHPFIAGLFGVLDDEENFYLVIELVENGNLLDYINTNKGLTEQQASRIFAQLASVLDYLHHEKHVVHRDLKAEDVLLDANYNIRVVDFGLSRAFTKGNPFLQTTCGSPAYVSPEIIKEEPYTAAADVWSSGILLSSESLRQRSSIKHRKKRAGLQTVCKHSFLGPMAAGPFSVRNSWTCFFLNPFF